jgi:hypothetical protein
MSFLGDGQTVSSVSITNANGSSETYSPAASGYWSESLFDNVGNLTETLQYGEIYNSQTGTYMLGTQEVQYPSGAMTFWPAGDPDAPSAVLPSGAPTDLASAQTLWTSMVSADKGVGT